MYELTGSTAALQLMKGLRDDDRRDSLRRDGLQSEMPTCKSGPSEGVEAAHDRAESSFLLALP